ncbi:hypothetical protein XELAEV_18001916mg [Xenopus laevis]|nr:hypothetical protein XELAEV_18001916mg [Xenopus laevis]
MMQGVTCEERHRGDESPLGSRGDALCALSSRRRRCVKQTEDGIQRGGLLFSREEGRHYRPQNNTRIRPQTVIESCCSAADELL